MRRARPELFGYSVPGLEPLLVHSATTREAPAINTTYALCNPLDDRMRLFTGLREEHMFIRELAHGLRGLDDVLNRLAVLATDPVDSPAVLEAVSGLLPAWEPMIATTVAMLRRMPPEVFSGRIIPYFAALNIDGATYQGVTGAQNLNVAIDYVIWGIEVPADNRYHAYARTNLEEQLPAHRELVADVLDRTGGASLLTHIERQLAAAPGSDWHTARTVLVHIESFLRRISTFRAVHRRLAMLNLPLRETKAGSGGHTLDLLDLLAAFTTKARKRTHALRHLAGGPGAAPRQRRVAPVSTDTQGRGTTAELDADSGERSDSVPCRIPGRRTEHGDHLHQKEFHRPSLASLPEGAHGGTGLG